MPGWLRLRGIGFANFIPLRLRHVYSRPCDFERYLAKYSSMAFLNRFLPPPSQVFTDPDYVAAYEFKNTFTPTDGKDYAWTVDYAKFTFAQLQHADETLDRKAESIMRTLGGGSGLLSLGAVLNLSKIGTAPAFAIAAALLLALLAVLAAAWVRVPRNVLLPPSVAWALSYVDAYDKSQERFLAQWHLACEATRLSIRAKAWGVALATWLGVASVCAVAISFIIAFATMTDSQTSIAKDQNMTQNSSDEGGNSAPDPSAAPQTPPPTVADPQNKANPQSVQANENPAQQAGPQTLQFSDDRPMSQRDETPKSD